MRKGVLGCGFEFLARSEILSFEEIPRLARIFVAQGVRKLRITGGEPLVRKDVERLIALLAALEGGDDLTVTTQGSLPNGVFKSMNDVDFPVGRVLEGIEAAAAAGLSPVKVNMVVKRGVNDHTVLEMARYFRGRGQGLRFIENRDVGNASGWRLDDVVPAGEIIARINAEMPLEPVDPNYRGEVARRYRYKDGSGEIGVIASVSQPFCGDCTRARLSAEGKLYTCLFASRGHDPRALLRGGKSDDQ